MDATAHETEERIGTQGLRIPEGVEEGDYDDPNSWASGMVGVAVGNDGHFYNEKTGMFVKGGASPNKHGMNGANGKRFNTFKKALMEAFEEIGYDEFVLWAKANKTKFYQLCGKMIPLDVKLEAAHKHMHVVMSLPPPAMEGMVNIQPGSRQLPDGSTIVTEFTVPPNTPTDLPETAEQDLVPTVPVVNQPGYAP